MAGFDPIGSLKEIGGAFRFGRGVLGKSAIPLMVLMAAAMVAAFRLHSDIAIIGSVILAAIVFFLWFFPVLKFCEKHPDVALLEGAEWTGYKQFEATAKYLPSRSEQQQTPEPGSRVLDVIPEADEETDK